MTKKQMEERIAQLEKMVMELQSQFLMLSFLMPKTITVTVPSTPPQPIVRPYLPYIGTTISSPSTQYNLNELKVNPEALAR